ncbi:MAG: DUF5519 family protein [Anaerolineae bacterium]|nr:DUF5519 family protein [Anaerolineae bacterium]
MREKIEHIKQTVTGWPEVTSQTHRFGGLEFNLGSVEIGHIHHNGMVDIPFNSKIRAQLLAEKKAEPHHLLPETGWITFYIRSAADVEQALWLFRLSYLFYASRGSQKTAMKDVLDIPAAVEALHPSVALRAVLSHAIGAVGEGEVP